MNTFKFLLLFCLCATAAFAQQNPFRFDADIATYHYNIESSYVEVYVSFATSALTYQKDGSDYIGAATIHVTVADKDSVEYTQQWVLKRTLHDSAEQFSKQFLIDVTGFVVPQGKHVVRVLASDYHNPSRRDSLMFPLQFTAFDTTKTTISNLELCSNIVKAESDDDKKSPFYKNSYIVYPNPSALYGQGLPVLFYFAECYNLMQPNAPADYNLILSVYNTVRTEVLHQEKKKHRAVNNVLEVGTLNVSALKSGTYTFALSMQDSARTISSTKKFFIYNPGKGIDSTIILAVENSLKNEFSTLNDDQLNEEYAKIAPIAVAQEAKEYALLKTLDAKRNFFVDFWKRRNLDDEGNSTSFKTKYYERIDYANEHFTMSKGTKFSRPGWKTDKGRIYLIYGEPDEIKRRPNNPDFHPYEIWDYHQIEGGISFFFVDEYNSNQMRLVHSTARNEIHDSQWEEKINNVEAGH